MARLAAYAIALAVGLAATLALASCGSESDAKLLPGNTAQEIGENVDAVKLLVDEEECVDAQDAALEVSAEVEALRGIDPKLKEALEKAAARLNEVVGECEEETEDTTELETVPETTESEEEPEKKGKKPKKEPEETLPEEEEKETPKPPAEPPEPPGKAKGHEKEEAPPAEEAEGGPSGGIGPGAATGEGG